ncbi:uncharacterized protein BJ171DRAFT_118897 [Polychytrium aggregatum]|uniref:uncharacterized protein n=1 Tax=Polychytrium aggregatum TaxID=110093 RepID=UPI0022FE0D3B|nr:uncharacterized protein BJ171DRAFT_118897 [Polychytrium aggregatum]KAI9209503.1 hypothetical protein BJ171DRAFT_118897 [Polychytrium aggregatum]
MASRARTWTRLLAGSSASSSSTPRSLMVSSPHPASNIRLLELKTPESRSALLPEEVAYLEALKDAQHFHHTFWTGNNQSFIARKAEFETEVFRQHNRSATPEELSRFYKIYLDDSFDRHMLYNRECWKLNFALLPPYYRAQMAYFRRALLGAHTASSRAAASSVFAPIVSAVDSIRYVVRNWYWAYRFSSMYRAQGVTYR